MKNLKSLIWTAILVMAVSAPTFAKTGTISTTKTGTISTTRTGTISTTAPRSGTISTTRTGTISTTQTRVLAGVDGFSLYELLRAVFRLW